MIGAVPGNDGQSLDLGRRNAVYPALHFLDLRPEVIDNVDLTLDIIPFLFREDAIQCSKGGLFIPVIAFKHDIDVGTVAPILCHLDKLTARPDGIAIVWHFGNSDLVIRSEEHTSELQSLMRISYAVFCLKKKKKTIKT